MRRRVRWFGLVGLVGFGSGLAKPDLEFKIRRQTNLAYIIVSPQLLSPLVVMTTETATTTTTTMAVVMTTAGPNLASLTRL